MDRQATITIPVDHPAFAGHFPGAPIVPGVVLLDEALFAMQGRGDAPLQAYRIAMAKFFHPVGPGATLVIRSRTLADGSIRFEIMAGERMVAGGSVIVAAPGEGGPG